MSLANKIKHEWGYDVGMFPPNVVLSFDGKDYCIDHWPDDNPPTIAEIEAVVVPEPEPVPNWEAFSTGVNSLSFYASKILLGAASNLFPALVHNVETKNTARVGELLSLMIITYSLTTAEVAEFQQLLDDCDIDITLQGP